MLDKICHDYGELTIAKKIELCIFATWAVFLPIVTATDYLIDSRSGPMSFASMLPQIFTFALPVFYVILGALGKSLTHRELSKERFERTSFDSDGSLQAQSLRFDYLIKIGIGAGIATIIVYAVTNLIMTV